MTDPQKDAGRLFARLVLVRRLVDHHGIDPADALAAVLAVERSEPHPDTELVHAEARAATVALLQPLARLVRDTFEAIRPALQAAAAALNEAAAATHEAYALAPTPPGRRRDRPAWQTPYGPPTRHHR